MNHTLSAFETVPAATLLVGDHIEPVIFGPDLIVRDVRRRADGFVFYSCMTADETHGYCRVVDPLLTLRVRRDA